MLLEAATPILKALAHEHGYSQLAVFGSVARHQARADSDIDLLVGAPEDTSSFDFLRFKSLVEQVLGREVELVGILGEHLAAHLDQAEASQWLFTVDGEPLDDNAITWRWRATRSAAKLPPCPAPRPQALLRLQADRSRLR